MPVRTTILKKAQEEELKKNRQKIPATPTWGQKSRAKFSWIIFVEGKQIGHIFATSEECVIYVKRHGLDRKLPRFERVADPLTTKCSICRGQAHIVGYKLDKIIYLCSNKHRMEVRRY